jgi:GT2 family glycosyltransferase
MKLTIIIPVYISDPLHLDFTRQTLESIQTTHDYQVIIVNNYCSPQFQNDLSLLASGYTLVANPSGNILASAWNLGIRYAFKNRSNFCLILNNDLILHPQCIDNLVSFAGKHPEFLLWSASEWANSRTLTKALLTPSFSPHPHFSCFMLSSQTVKKVGYFDEHFTMGYFEDNDYHTRILLKGDQAAATDSAKFYHYGSRTINVDDRLRIEGKYHYQLNRVYFQKKWGLDIHGRAFSPPETILKEIYPHPFNKTP